MVAGVWLMRSPFGRTIIATGDNPDAAALAGAHVWWVKTRAFMLSSISATIAGILLVGYAGVHPSVGAGYEFTAITAVVRALLDDEGLFLAADHGGGDLTRCGVVVHRDGSFDQIG